MNNLAPGDVPSELKLGYMELQAVRLVRLFISVYRAPKRLTHSRGQVVHISADAEKSVESLRPFFDDGKLLAVSQKKAKNSEYETLKYSVNISAVEVAVAKLREINPLYAHINTNIFPRDEEEVHGDEVLVDIDVCNSYGLYDFTAVVPVEFMVGRSRILNSDGDPTWTGRKIPRHLTEYH